MIVCFIVLLALVLCINMFSISICSNSINRIIIYTPKELFETSIPLLTNEDIAIPHFDKNILIEKLTSYYDEKLPQYCKFYGLEFYFYNQEDLSYCASEYCQAVEITVTTRLNFGIEYEKAIFYEIRKGAYGK